MDKLNAQLAHMDTRHRMINKVVMDTKENASVHGKVMRNLVVQQQEVVNQFKEDMHQSILDGNSRSDAVNELIKKYKGKDKMNFLPIVESKAVKKGVKMDSPAIKTLLKMGEDIAEGNKQAKKKRAEEEELNHHVQRRTDAYLKDFYEQLNKN